MTTRDEHEELLQSRETIRCLTRELAEARTALAASAPTNAYSADLDAMGEAELRDLVMTLRQSVASAPTPTTGDQPRHLLAVIDVLSDALRTIRSAYTSIQEMQSVADRALAQLPKLMMEHLTPSPSPARGEETCSPECGNWITNPWAADHSPSCPRSKPRTP